ncbi:substrate-binding domain-containing protein [Brachybacterium sp. Z12]|uniref:substrate-binding domain-containing protein n=1 Tax=Brachybacterium sp. Z12 TaxID=2759167 RepID=UPI0037C0934A
MQGAGDRHGPRGSAAGRAGRDARLDAAREQDLSCIVCPVDYVALDLLRAAAARGVRIPEDVSTVGFDGLSDGLDLLGLATLRLPVAEVAQAAVARMEELLVAAQDDAEGPPPPRRPRCGTQSSPGT